MVANAKTQALPKAYLCMAWKKLENRWDPKSREDTIDSLSKFIQLNKWKHLNETPRLAGTYGEKEE